MTNVRMMQVMVSKAVQPILMDKPSNSSLYDAKCIISGNSENSLSFRSYLQMFTK